MADKLCYLAVIIAFIFGIAAGSMYFSTTETKTVTKWKNPDGEMMKYTINEIDATALYYKDGDLENISIFNDLSTMTALKSIKVVQ